MKTLHLIILALFILFVSACSEDAPVTPKIDPVVEKQPSKLSLLAQTWVLKETYTNGVSKTKNGTEEYLFSEEGGFFVKSKGNWEGIGSYHFVGSDSAQISVLFTGLNTPIEMDIIALNKTDFRTEFVSGGNTLNYNYVR